MHARIRRYYVRLNIFDDNKKHPAEVRSRDGHTCRTCASGRATLKCRSPPSLADVQVYFLSVYCKTWTNNRYLFTFIFVPVTYGYVEENRII